MGYVWQAMITRDEPLRAASRDAPEARKAPLRQTMPHLPMTDEALDAITDGSTAGGLRHRRLPGTLHAAARTVVCRKAGCLVETAYFGGAGKQRAAAWPTAHGRRGPLDTPTKHGPAVQR
jgi:hypothetical protein